ncbi:MAG: hypothetical protein Kow0092_10080 [Deferrisomatales bacterium]
MESLQELLELVLDWSFLPVALGLVLLTTVGSGWWTPRWRRTIWMVGVVLMGVTLYLGIQRHEWGEVLFNGQLL